ncbi:FecR family protein [Pedobacter sp. CFBP9032]|uniref:FecR family protein n=1 Tax=Pedobacter sp. CFBP9032 TaxID=3096539 RepID=UPI002A6A41B2|nr:FecR domain-containing protein [Pedobacter sp. CFBP9032]MDY0907672.1 FecR domain-containing protein [Pedobacter sp. CFBP9032]
MEQERSSYLFNKYVSRTCSPAELKEFMAIVKNADDATVIDLVMDNFWNQSPEVELNPVKADSILTKVLSSDAKKDAKTPNLSVQWLGWAAALFIICLATLYFNNKTKTTPPAANQTAKKVVQSDKPVELLTVKTGNEHQKVNLPDGSTVILNNNSSISYPKVFGVKRAVTLTGEGYFDIRHDLKKSFTVHTGNLSTVVLGTAFNIKAYDRDHEISVTVTRGKVSVLDSNAVLAILTPNQQITFNKKDKLSNLNKVIAKNTVQWQESDIFFDDISLEEAAQALSKRFNTTITVENDSSKKCRFTATFLKGESLDEILKIICSYNHAQYQTTAGGITIKGDGCE